MQFAHAAGANGFDHLRGLRIARQFLQRIALRVVHRRGNGHRRWQKGLHLIEPEVSLLEPQGQIEHVLIRCSGVRGDEIRNQILLLACFLRILVEQQLELVVGADARLHHVRQRPVFGMFRRNLQIAADVMRNQFLDIVRRTQGKIVTQARADQHPLHALDGPCLAVELDKRRVVGIQVLADAGVYAGKQTA